MNGLSDESRDLCSPPARPVGNGRFDGGQLRVGRGDAAQSLDVFANGTDFLESLPGGFYIYARLRDGSNNILCTAVVVSSPAGFDGNNSLCTTLFVSDPEGLGSFDLRLPQCSWDAVTASATKLEIGGVEFQITSAGSARTEGGYQLATVVVKAGVMLPFHLVDDDVTTASFPVSVLLLQDSDDATNNVFAAAYIRPRQLVYENKKTARFRRNVATMRIGPDTIISPQADEVRDEGKEDDFPSSANYWVAYLQGAFQEGEAWDNDPSDELAVYGLTKVGKALIFGESLRDNAEFSEGDCSALTPPHEIGHMFGLEHTLTLRGLMGYSCDAGNAFFRPEHLREIRKGVIQ